MPEHIQPRQWEMLSIEVTHRLEAVARGLARVVLSTPVTDTEDKKGIVRGWMGGVHVGATAPCCTAEVRVLREFPCRGWCHPERGAQVPIVGSGSCDSRPKAMTTIKAYGAVSWAS